MSSTCEALVVREEQARDSKVKKLSSKSNEALMQ